MKIYNKLMSIFDILPGKKKPPETISVTIDFRDDCFILNDKSFFFPARLSELKQVLGAPRTTGFTIDPFYTEERLNSIREDYNISPKLFTPERHYWDNLGIMVSTYERETVRCFTVYLRKSKYPVSMPKHPFRGTLLINGKPWQERVLTRGRMRETIPLGKLHLSVIYYGNATSEKSVKHFELSLNHTEKLAFFDDFGLIADSQKPNQGV